MGIILNGEKQFPIIHLPTEDAIMSKRTDRQKELSEIRQEARKDAEEGENKGPSQPGFFTQLFYEERYKELLEDHEVYEETFDHESERIGEVMSELLVALLELREKQEAEAAAEAEAAEYERQRPARIAREEAERKEKERKERIKAKNVRLGKLAATIVSRGYTSEELSKKVSWLTNKHEESEEYEMWKIAASIEVILNSKAPEFYAKLFIGNADPAWDIAAKSAMEVIRKKKTELIIAKVGSLEGKTDEQLYQVIREYPFENVSLQAIERMNDKDCLKRVYNFECLDIPTAKKAEERFYEIVKQERKERGFFGDIKHLLSNIHKHLAGHERDDKL